MSEPSWGDQGQQGQGDAGRFGATDRQGADQFGSGQHNAGQHNAGQHNAGQQDAGQYSVSAYDPTRYDPALGAHVHPQAPYGGPNPQLPGYAQPGYQQPGSQQPAHPQPWQPGLPLPPQMTPVQNVLVGPGQRPLVVVISFALWVAASLAWPLGTLSLVLHREGDLGGGGSVMSLFFSSCVAIGGVACAVRLLRGGAGARLGLAFGGVVIGLFALLLEVGGDGGDVLDRFVVVLRLGLPLLAAVLSFLPPAKHHFAAGVR
ncbi:hypothetical protein [Actinosynnema mirum]|uniref:Uncharacterized protein n=1 Tax=Actinosynnema mirum (strain ATCC 29888 / DSM 43827 / JCM 3225 / NBRC 14064 / NCIMB 13271 / NRRL B-12336 / IMRU 3971 / 101) TaxID=446462 RepID=C6WNF5_ACTMD|nr:hypothetical protein [Actinosynnema mirum]ACU40519.1 hypothetical protein Amir_6722 [Actinosynnema mirum DSM 43827]